MVDGSPDPYVVIEFQFVKPGKGQAFTRVKLRNMANGNVLERTLKSGEKITPADVEQRQLQYIYPEGTDFVFMDAGSGEQLTVSGDKIGDDSKWLKENLPVKIHFLDGSALEVELPPAVDLKVVETEPQLKGATITNVYKTAKLETGAVVQVPPFISQGELIRVDTRSGEYLERAGK